MRERKERSQSFEWVIESVDPAKLCKINAIDMREKDPVRSAKHVNELIRSLLLRLQKKEGGDE